MKNLSIEDIVAKVRVKLDEIGLDESEMMDALEDNTNLDSVIKSCIAEAYRLINMSADISMLEGVQGTVSLSIDSNKVGRVTLPDNFLRLVSVRLSSWISSYSKLITENSPEYRMQSNEWVCGSPECPVAALVHRSEGRVLELFKAASSSDTLSSFVYIPSVTSDSESVDISDQLAESLIYYVAALTMVTFREDVANDFFKVGRSLIGIE